MQERTDLLARRLLYVGMVGIVIVVGTLVWFGYSWFNEIKPGSEKVTPNTFFCTLGEPLEEDVVFSVSQSEKLYQTEQSFSGILAGYAFDQFPEINLLYQIWQAYTGNMKTKHLTDTEQLFEIPVNANAIESPKERAELKKSLPVDGTFDFLDMDMQLYAWNVEKRKRSGTEITEIHVVMCLDGDIFIATMGKEGNHKFKVDIRHGKYVEQGMN